MSRTGADGTVSRGHSLAELPTKRDPQRSYPLRWLSSGKNDSGFSRPEEEVLSSGQGSLKFLQASFTPDFLAAQFDALHVSTPTLSSWVTFDRPQTWDWPISLKSMTPSRPTECRSRSSTSTSCGRRWLTALFIAMRRDRSTVAFASSSSQRGRGASSTTSKPIWQVTFASPSSAPWRVSAGRILLAPFAIRSGWRRTPSCCSAARPGPWISLARRKLSIREVAERCGFADQAHLTRCFGAIKFGHPPPPCMRSASPRRRLAKLLRPRFRRLGETAWRRCSDRKHRREHGIGLSVRLRTKICRSGGGSGEVHHGISMCRLASDGHELGRC